MLDQRPAEEKEEDVETWEMVGVVMNYPHGGGERKRARKMIIYWSNQHGEEREVSASRQPSKLVISPSWEV